MPLIRNEDNKNTGYSYDIVTACEGSTSKCGKVVFISKVASRCALQYDLADGSLISGKETATSDELDWANYYVHTHLRDWQAETGLHYIVKFCAESDCYYDFTARKLYNASGKKNKKSIEKKPVKFTPDERKIITRLVKMVGFACEYADISLAVTGSEDGMTPKTIHVHMSNIRAYDDVAIRPVIEKSGNGYTYVGQPAEWSMQIPEKKQDPKKYTFALRDYGKKLLDTGEIARIACLTQNQGVEVHNTSEVTLGVICNFFFPGAMSWIENGSDDSLEHVDKTSLVRYINAVCHAPDSQWDASLAHIREQLGLAVKLRLYPMINPSDPTPKTNDDLSRVTIQVDNFVDGIFDLILDWVSSLINENTYINTNFFMGKAVQITKANLLDAVVALSWISLHQELSYSFPLLSEEVEKYRKALSRIIKRIFFAPTSAELEALMAVCEAAREAFDRAMIDLDDKKERKEAFDKVLVELLNLSEILRNSGIRLPGGSNANNNGTPSKVR